MQAARALRSTLALTRPWKLVVHKNIDVSIAPAAEPECGDECAGLTETPSKGGAL